MIYSANQLTGFYMKGTFAFSKLMFHFLKSNFQWYHTKVYSVEIILKKTRDKHVFLLYISSSSLRKRLMHAYGLTLMSLFIKIMMRNYEACPVTTPKIIFFRRGNYGTLFDNTALYCLKPISHFKSSLLVCLYYPNK